MKKFYEFTPYEATGIVEGFLDAQSEEHVVAAWQYLHDTGHAYQLQGWFGRTAQQLIREGTINV